MRLQSLLKQINLLNCLLLAGISAFGLFVLLPLFTIGVKVPAPVLPKATELETTKVAEQAANPPPQDYSVIAENNLFHPERIIPPEKKEALAVPRPEFVLYGTLITDNVRIAYLSDKKVPRNTPGRGKRQTNLKIGEIMSGYTLKEVKTDRVIMVRGDDRIEVRVIEPGIKKDRNAETAKPGISAAAPQLGTPAQAVQHPAASFPGPGMPVPNPAIGIAPSVPQETPPIKTRRVDTNAMKQLRQSLINQPQPSQ